MKPRCPHHAPEKVMNIDAFSEWEEMEKKGLKQRQCPDCLRWFFRGEFGKGWGKGLNLTAQKRLNCQNFTNIAP